MKKILCVIDCQNDFITGSLRNEEAIKKVPNITKKIRNFKGDCIYVTLDTHGSDYLDTKEGEKLPVPHCIYQTEGWELEPNIKAALNDAELRNIPVVSFMKPTFGCPSMVEHMLSNYGTEECEIDIIGFCTDICVITNALLVKTAFFKNANVAVHSYCCAGVTPDTHIAALKTMEMCQINVD